LHSPSAHASSITPLLPSAVFHSITQPPSLHSIVASQRPSLRVGAAVALAVARPATSPAPSNAAAPSDPIHVFTMSSLR
jgi:hypothetical protein